MNIKKKYVDFKNINKHGLIFHCNIRSDPMLGIGYVDFRWIQCRCPACLSKMDSPWNIRKNDYNKYLYKG